MRRLADELDADAMQEQVELLEVEGAVAIIINVLDEVVDLRYIRSRRETTTRSSQKISKGGPTEMDGASVGLS